MSSKLYEKDLFLNDNIFYFFNKSIYEYDMRNAGFNLTRAYNLLPKSKIEELGRMKKERRTIEIGKIQRKNDVYKDKLSKAFKEARRMFFEMNNIEDSDIISIKKDAIFTTKRCDFQKFLEFIEFREKNYYTSYIRLSKKIELYYSERQMDIKGLGKESLEYHKDYLVHFIHLYFKKMECDEPVAVLEFIRKFIDKYKRRELSVGYYRRFERDAYFQLINDDSKYYEYWEENKDELDITYNYFEVFIKLAKILL